LQIYSNDAQTPTPGPSKSYAIDFKGKIARKFILRFRRLSGSVGRFLHLATLGSVPDSPQKSTVIANISHTQHPDAIGPQVNHAPTISTLLNALFWLYYWK